MRDVGKEEGRKEKTTSPLPHTWPLLSLCLSFRASVPHFIWTCIPPCTCPCRVCFHPPDPQPCAVGQSSYLCNLPPSPSFHHCPPQSVSCCLGTWQAQSSPTLPRSVARGTKLNSESFFSCPGTALGCLCGAWLRPCWGSGEVVRMGQGAVAHSVGSLKPLMNAFTYLLRSPLYTHMHTCTLCKRKFHSAFRTEFLLDRFSRSSDALPTPDPQQHITLMPMLEKGSASLCTPTFTPPYCYWHTYPLLFSFYPMSGKEIFFLFLSSFPGMSVMLVPWLIFLLFSLVPLFPQSLSKYWIKEPFCLRNASWELIRASWPNLPGFVFECTACVHVGPSVIFTFLSVQSQYLKLTSWKTFLD